MFRDLPACLKNHYNENLHLGFISDFTHSAAVARDEDDDITKQLALEFVTPPAAAADPPPESGGTDDGAALEDDPEDAEADSCAGGGGGGGGGGDVVGNVGGDAGGDVGGDVGGNNKAGSPSKLVNADGTDANPELTSDRSVTSPLPHDSAKGLLEDSALDTCVENGDGVPMQADGAVLSQGNDTNNVVAHVDYEAPHVVSYLEFIKNSTPTTKQKIISMLESLRESTRKELPGGKVKYTSTDSGGDPPLLGHDVPPHAQDVAIVKRPNTGTSAEPRKKQRLTSRESSSDESDVAKPRRKQGPISSESSSDESNVDEPRREQGLISRGGSSEDDSSIYSERSYRDGDSGGE